MPSTVLMLALALLLASNSQLSKFHQLLYLIFSIAASGARVGVQPMHLPVITLRECDGNNGYSALLT